jgi:hypothetical protein
LEGVAAVLEEEEEEELVEKERRDHFIKAAEARGEASARGRLRQALTSPENPRVKSPLSSLASNSSSSSFTASTMASSPTPPPSKLPPAEL